MSNRMSSLVPLGLTDTGTVFYAVFSHLLVVGQTGSGKGSVIWAFIMGVERMLAGQNEAGWVRFYGVLNCPASDTASNVSVSTLMSNWMFSINWSAS